jgi:hypothetical protein
LKMHGPSCKMEWGVYGQMSGILQSFSLSDWGKPQNNRYDSWSQSQDLNLRASWYEATTPRSLFSLPSVNWICWLPPQPPPHLEQNSWAHHCLVHWFRMHSTLVVPWIWLRHVHFNFFFCVNKFGYVCMKTNKCASYSFILLIIYGSCYMFRHYIAIFREHS